MKVSELIEELQIYLREQGDLEVFRVHDELICAERVESVYSREIYKTEFDDEDWADSPGYSTPVLFIG